MLNYVFGVCVLHCFFCSHDVATVEGADEKEKGREGRVVRWEEEPLPEGEHQEEQDTKTEEDRYFLHVILNKTKSAFQSIRKTLDIFEVSKSASNEP